MTRNFKIRDATVADIPIILQLIRDLATYERAPNDVVATEKGLHEVLFGAEPAAKVVRGFEKSDTSMPSYDGLLSDLQVEALILYIKTLR
jgi:hypothetical protein